MKISRHTVAALVAALAFAIITYASSGEHHWLLARRHVTGLWSKPGAWGGKVNGPDVVIPAGVTVILNVSPPPLRTLRIDGTLDFAEKDLILTAGEITVNGALRVGAENRPFRHRAEIVLGYPSPGSASPVDTRISRSIDVIGGVLDLHGRHHSVTWTHLSSTAFAGDRVLHLADPVDWEPGDGIVVASTDYDPAECETFVVKERHGCDLVLDHDLKFDHHGSMEDGVDERAEVGLLSHNIVVHGADDGVRQGYGGQIMMMDGGVARIADTECYHMGQLGRLGCYPIHFHRLGPSPSSYVRSSSVHHCFNRCITIHGTSGVHLTSNVCFDTIGHCYFMEDGLETHNVIRGNLGLMTRRAKKGLEVIPSDLRPATFWITNPNNVVEDNCAAGSEEFGFWYALPKHPTGASRTVATDRSIWPRRTALGVFRGNVAHSNGGDGLNVDNAPNPPGVSETPTYTPPVEARFEDFTAYKNRKHGVWLRGIHLNLVRCRLADNPIGVTLAASQSQVTDGLIVGQTRNHPDSVAKPDQPAFPIRGFEFYDGLVGVRDTTFINFQPNALREAGALSYLRFSPFFVDPRNWIQGCRFENCNRVFLDSMRTSTPQYGGDGYRSAVFIDRDGCVTGQPGASVAVDNPLVLGKDARFNAAWNAYVQTESYGRLFIDDRSTRGRYLGPVSVALDSTERAEKLWGVPDTTPRSFQSVVITGRKYAAQLTGAPSDLRITLRSYRPNDWIELALPLRGRSVDVYAGDGLRKPLTRVATPQALDNAGISACCIHGSTCLIRLKVKSGDDSAVARLVYRDPDRTAAINAVPRIRGNFKL